MFKVNTILFWALSLSYCLNSEAITDRTAPGRCPGVIDKIKEKNLEKAQTLLEDFARKNPDTLDLATLLKPRGTNLDSPRALAKRLVLSRLAAMGRIPTFSQRALAATRNDYKPQSAFLTQERSIPESTLDLVENNLIRVSTSDFIQRLDVVLANSQAPTLHWSGRGDYIDFLLSTANARLKSYYGNPKMRFFVNADSPAFKQLLKKSESMERSGIKAAPPEDIKADLFVASYSLISDKNQPLCDVSAMGFCDSPE